MTMLNQLYNIRDFSTQGHPRFPLSLGIEVELEHVAFNSTASDDYDEDDDLGEVSGYTAPTSITEYWNVHEDGSLRDGLEFSFARPLSGNFVEYAVDALFSGIADYDNTPRCSTHIHVGAGDLSVENLQAFVALLACVEEGIYNLTTPDRKWCGYAMPITSMSNARLRKLFSTTNVRDFMAGVSPAGSRQERYYGCNLMALAKFGTIEFRYFQGVEGQSTLLTWADMVTHLMKNATTLSWPILHEASADMASFTSLLSSFLGIYYNTITADLDLGNAKEVLESMLAMAEYEEEFAPRDSTLLFYSDPLASFISTFTKLNEPAKSNFTKWFKSIRASTASDVMYRAQWFAQEAHNQELAADAQLLNEREPVNIGSLLNNPIEDLFERDFPTHRPLRMRPASPFLATQAWSTLTTEEEFEAIAQAVTSNHINSEQS